MHSSKFDLGGQPWNEPLAKISELNNEANQPLITYMIGQVVELDKEKQIFK